MLPELTRRAPRGGGYTGSNWRGIGRVEVHADMPGSGVAQGAVLVVNFNRRQVVAGGQFLVDIDGVPELLRLKRFTCGLRARIGGRWFDVAGDALNDMDVIGRVVKVLPGAIS